VPAAGSQPFHNVRWEKFTQGLAAGKPQGRAYKEAGFRPNSRAASKLASRPEILARLDWIRRQALADTTLSIQRVVAELEKMAFANMLDYVRIDDDGNAILDLRNMTRDQAAAILEITTDEITSPRNGEVTRRTRLKLGEKRGTLMDLGKWLGMYKKADELNVKGIIFHMDANDMAL